MLVAVSYWGIKVVDNHLLKWVLGIVLPIIIAVIWGTLGSPGASLQLQGMYKYLLEFLLYGVAILALYSVGKTTLAIVFVILVIVNGTLMYVWNQ